MPAAAFESRPAPALINHTLTRKAPWPPPTLSLSLSLSLLQMPEAVVATANFGAPSLRRGGPTLSTQSVFLSVPTNVNTLLDS